MDEKKSKLPTSPKDFDQLRKQAKTSYISNPQVTKKELSETLDVGYSTIRKWSDDDDWETARKEHMEARARESEILLDSSQAQLLQYSADDLSRIIFLMTRRGVEQLQDEGTNAKFPLKTLTDALDKLRRLQVHIENGGVQKHAHLNMTINEDFVRSLILEVAIEVENQTGANSREIIAKIFSEKLSDLMKKIK